MIRITYEDYEITYDERDDFWCCPTLKVTARTLSSLKAKIAKMDADLRRLPAVAVIAISPYQFNWENGWRATLLDDSHKSVWAVMEKKREKMSLDRLTLDTAENRRAMLRAKVIYEKGNELQKQAMEMLRAIPRVTAEELRGFSDQWKEAGE